MCLLNWLHPLKCIVNSRYWNVISVLNSQASEMVSSVSLTPLAKTSNSLLTSRSLVDQKENSPRRPYRGLGQSLRWLPVWAQAWKVSWIHGEAESIVQLREILFRLVENSSYHSIRVEGWNSPCTSLQGWSGSIDYQVSHWCSRRRGFPADRVDELCVLPEKRLGLDRERRGTTGPSRGPQCHQSACLRPWKATEGLGIPQILRLSSATRHPQTPNFT